jgi:hypothetical protein
LAKISIGQYFYSPILEIIKNAFSIGVTIILTKKLLLRQYQFSTMNSSTPIVSFKHQLIHCIANINAEGLMLIARPILSPFILNVDGQQKKKLN